MKKSLVKHAPPALEQEVAQLEEGEAWDEADEVVHVEAKAPLDKVIPGRLSASQWDQLRAEAKEIGIGPTTLARMWLLELLKEKTKAAR